VRESSRYLELRGVRDTQTLIRTAMEHGEVNHFEIIHPTLHDIFVRIARPQPEEMLNQPTVTGEDDA